MGRSTDLDARTRFLEPVRAGVRGAARDQSHPARAQVPPWWRDAPPRTTTLYSRYNRGAREGIWRRQFSLTSSELSGP
jgi:hypothetical protein